MSGATDNGMVKMMGIIMGSLCVFAVLLVLAARLLGSGSDDYSDPLKRNALIQRLQPQAAVRTSADDLPAGDAQLAMADGPAKSAEELVNGACAACHISGAAGAPLLDDDAAWAERREAGLDALVASVINGKGAMPARGGSAYSDEEIRLAVQQMAGFDVDEAAAAEGQVDATAEASEEVADEQVLDDSASEAAVEESSAVEQAPEAESSEQANAPADTAMAELVVGQVPEGLTDNVKTTVDGVCAGCHLAGVAGAPKNGDTAAWQERADKGLAALTSSVINGLNVMPARGGSTLSDEEIPMAIQYLMSK